MFRSAVFFWGAMRFWFCQMVLVLGFTDWRDMGV